MKKPTKSIITSSLLALAFGAMSVGTTFALFTSQSQTEINVGSGVVNVQSSASLAKYESSVDGSDVNLTGLTTYSNELVGNRFSLEGSTVTIDKMVPGDSLTLKLSAVNKSNVKTKTRYVVNHSVVGTKTDLYPALKFTFSAGTLSEADLFKWQVNDPVADISTGVALYEDLSVTITFPDGDNGQILFGSANHDNQYQDAACSIAFSLQAVQANAATSPIDEINAYLEVEKMLGHENFTMHDAVLDMAAIGYTDLSVLEGYVYGLANDQFVKESTVTANKLDYFKVYESMPDEQTFSIYAAGSNWTTVEALTVGFDAGDTSGVTSITYDRHDATVGQEVTIRTNTAQTTLTINAPKDTIHHYDALGALNIIEAATASYHEFGSIAYAEIAKGRIVLEKGADVNQIHINKKTDSTFDTVIIANNGGTEELPEKITRDAVTVEEETLVVKVESNGSSENVYVYADGGTKGSTEKVTEGENKQNENVNSDLGQLVLDNGSAGEKAQTSQEKEDAKAEVVENAIIDEIEEDEDNVARIDKVGYKTFNAAWSAGANKTIILLKDITLNALQISGNRSLDLNEHKLTLRGHPQAGSDGTTGAAIFIDGGGNWSFGNLTLQNGTLDMTGANYSKNGIYSYGSFTLKDLTINSACENVIYCNGQAYGGSGTATLDNVTINATHSSGTAVAAYALKNWQGTIRPTVEIKNSRITGACNAVMMYAVNATVDSSVITATNNNALWAQRAAMASGVTGTVTVKGNTTINAGSDYKRIHAQDGNSIAIIEGTYNFNPTSYVDLNELGVTDNGDGTWTVAEPVSVYDGTTYEELGSNNRGWQVQTATNRFEYITSPDFESLSEASTWERAASVEAYQAALAAAQAEIDLLENDPSIGIVVDETPNGGVYNGGTFRITNAKGLAYVSRLGDYLSAKNEIVGIQNGNVNTKYYYYWDWNVSVEINIDLNNLNWKPIVAQFKEFTFNNHIVSNLRVTGANSAGLFADIRGTTHVKDLIIENANISSNANSSYSSAGALSGNVSGGTITNITVRNAVISNAKYMGGLIGYSYASAVNNNILENISIQGAFHTAGGLTGYNCQEAEQPERYLEGNTLTNVSITAAESPTKTYFGTFIGRCNTVGNLYCRNNTLTNVTGSDKFCGNIANGTVVTE